MTNNVRRKKIRAKQKMLTFINGCALPLYRYLQASFLVLVFCAGAFGQCSNSGNLFATGTAGTTDNTSSLCTNFALQVVTQGPIANYTLTLEQDSGGGFMTAITCTTVPRCNMTTTIAPAPNRLRVNLTVLNSIPAGGYVQWGFAGSVPQPTTGITINTSAPITGGGNVSPGGALTIACPTCGSGAPSGPAGGDLSGTYPNPTVAKVNGNTPGNTCTNQFTRSINSSAVGTCATVQNTDLANTTITVNGTVCTLGSSCTPAGGANITQGTFASLPGTCTTNDLYYQTDGPYTFRCSATNTFSAFLEGFGLVTVPPSASWTSVNFGTTTADSTNGQRYFTGVQANSSAQGLRVQTRTAPATPYAITAGIRHDGSGALPGSSGNVGWWGLVFSDGTKLVSFLVGFNASGGDFFNAKWTNSTTFSANYVDQPSGTNFSVVEHFRQEINWLCETDDGTNLTWFWSVDRQHWKQFDQRLRGDFLTTGPTVVGWGGDPFSNTQELALVDWTVNNAATCK